MLKLSEANALDRETFTKRIGPIFEHSPWVAARTEARRPFQTREELYSALCTTVRSADADEKLALIRAHPDLAERAKLTPESQGEQSAAGLGELTNGERGAFEKFNRAYRERFGFPFVICARLNQKDAILQAFPERLKHSREEEIDTALNEIFKIADLRLRDLISE